MELVAAAAARQLLAELLEAAVTAAKDVCKLPGGRDYACTVRRL
jgi:hypothetical protein